ncbi:GP63 leishmanolysin, partial [Leptomonas seymouri]
MPKAFQHVVLALSATLLFLALLLPVAVATATAASDPDSINIPTKALRSHRCIHDELQQSVLDAAAARHPALQEGTQGDTFKQCTVTRTLARSGLPFVSSAALARTTAAAANTITWGRLRILVSTLDLYDNSVYCTPNKTYTSNKQGGYVACTFTDVLTDEKRETLTQYLLPQALRMHTERLRVQQVQGTWKVTDLHGVCANFQVPIEHTTVGVRDVDFIVYVASVPAQRDVVAWATTCQVHLDNRPAVGVINIPAANLLSHYDHYMIHTVAHEVAHALGFSGRFFSSTGISSTVTGIRGKTAAVPVVNSTTVVAKAREHFGCPTAAYMELEDAGGDGTMGSHWKIRNAADELMAPVSGAGYYTA